MNKIIDLHHHLETMHPLALIRSRIENHLVALSGHLKENTQTILSVPLYVQAWQKYSDLLKMIKELKRDLDFLGERVRLIETRSDLKSNFNLGIIIHIESARTIKKPESQLDQLFDLGVRGIIPVHFIDNHLGCSCDSFPRRFKLKRKDEGLSLKGEKFIEKMNELSMWSDLTHTTDNTANDILAMANHIMVSHVAIRDLRPKKRNKPIAFLKKVAQKNGVIGLTPWQYLLGKNYSLTDHLSYSIQAGIEDALCLGTDFGAPIKADTSLKSIFDCANMVDRLHIADKIKWDNAFTFFKRALPN